jgi:uncharacterized protein
VPEDPDRQDRPVVSDTTPLIVLAGVGLIDLLPTLYQEIWVPDAVLSEYAAGASPSEQALESLPWIRRKALSAPVDSALASQLDAGEAAAIALAQQVDARAVLLDEKAGRRIARERSFPVVGTLAILLRAKREGHIPAIGPILTEMIRQGRRVGPALREQVLRAAGE